MSFVVVTPPVSEPLTLSEVKDYLKEEDDTHDSLITMLIESSRRAVENYCGMGIMTQTVKETFDEFPNANDCIFLHRHPFGAITQLSYYDGDRATQQLQSNKYTTAGKGLLTRVGLLPNESWPTIAKQIGAVSVTYTIGYSSASEVPAAIKNAMLLMIANYYDRREDSVRRMPTQSEWLLDQYKLFTAK